MKITEVSRRNIIEGLIDSGVSWAGRLGDAEFLGRFLDLEKFPSTDRRHSTMSGDIWQHRVNNADDWPDNWIFTDPRMNLLGCEDEIFLRFLAETLHPIVRSNSHEVGPLLELYNQHLLADGFAIHESGSISGRPIFKGGPILRADQNTHHISNQSGELNQSPTFLTVTEVATILRVADADALELLEAGELQGFKVQGHWRIFSDHLIEFLGSASRKTQHEVMGKILLDPHRWLKSLAEFPELKADIEHGEHPEGSFGAWLQDAMRRTPTAELNSRDFVAKEPQSPIRHQLPIPLLHMLSEQLGNWYYSHNKINKVFTRAGAPGQPPDGNCVDKCRDWLIRINNDPGINPLTIAGNLLAEFMSKEETGAQDWRTTRDAIIQGLRKHGLAYDSSGHILPFAPAPSLGFSPTTHSTKPPKNEVETLRGSAPKRFDVALSFPGEHRTLVAEVAGQLVGKELERDRVFYDFWYKHELARPNLDTYLQKIYSDHTRLVVIFVCADYQAKEWCGLEWRAIRAMIKSKRDEEIMPFRLDNADVDGLLTIDGYIAAEELSANDIAEEIMKRLHTLQAR